MVGKEVPSGEPLPTQKQPQEQREGLPLPYVWDILSREVRLHNPRQLRPSRSSRRWLVLDSRVKEQKVQLRENGSDYDKAVLDFYATVTTLNPVSERLLTRQQLNLLRSDLEELSPAEIVEAKHQLIQDMHELRQEAFEISFHPES